MLQARSVALSAFALAFAFAGPAVAQVNFENGFTYQGRLTENSVPANAQYDIQFKLFNAATGGSQVGDVYQGRATAEQGLFTTSVYLAPQNFIDALFSSQNLYLQVEIRPYGSSDPYTVLAGRQPILGVPYAFGAQQAVAAANADTLDGQHASAFTSVASDYGRSGVATQLFEGTTALGNKYLSKTQSDTMNGTLTIHGAASNYGLVVDGTLGGLQATYSGGSSAHAAVEGDDTGGGSFGVKGTSIGLAGVYGHGSGASSYGVRGIAAGAAGQGVHGKATSATGVNFGVYGESASLDGAGVSGKNTAGTGSACGVKGSTASPAGRGVYGEATATSGQAIGVLGTTASISGIGVVGQNTSTGGFGIYGSANSGGYAGYFSGRGYFSDSLFCDGNVGIGTSSPSERLHVAGGIKADGGLLAASAELTSTIGKGLIAKGSTGAADFYGNVIIYEYGTTNKVIELGKGLDYAEGFEVAGGAKFAPGTVLILDPRHPGQLTISDKAYDRKVAGIVAGANGLGSGVRLGAGQYDHDVALAGRVYCNVDATETAVEVGDLLTTSSTRGYAMAVGDHQRAQGAVLGKAMEALPKGRKGQILVLVTLQ